MPPTHDLVTLARLHAALDSVVETEQLIAAIKEGSGVPSPSVTRLATVVREARELLRTMLSRSEARQMSNS